MDLFVLVKVSLGACSKTTVDERKPVHISQLIGHISPSKKNKYSSSDTVVLKSSIIFLVVPSPSNSHHQDYYICSREFQPKPSFATGILGDNR